MPLSWGFLTSRVKARSVHRIKDLPIGGTDLQVVARKHRLTSQEAGFPCRSFVQTIEQLSLAGTTVQQVDTEANGLHELRTTSGQPGRVRAPGFSAHGHGQRVNTVGELVGYVDHFHVIQRANLTITKVRRRRSHEVLQRSGRIADPAYKYRKLLTCNLEILSSKQVERLKLILESDPELGVIYGIKEHMRELLKTRDIHDFQSRWAVLEKFVRATKTVEANSLFRTLTAWLRQLLVFICTRLTNARSETANLTAKNLKRIGRGYRNHGQYRVRILLYTAGLRPC